MKSNFFANKSSPERRHNQFIVVIFLPGELDQIVSPLREKYDPTYNTIGSHLTLVFPFSTSGSLDSLVSAIKSPLEKMKPIKIELESIGDFYPEFPCIYWNVKRTDALCELYYGLYSSLDLPLIHKHYVPHVTVACEISPHRVMPVKDTIALHLPRENFIATTVDLLTPIGDMKWVSVRTISFGQ